MLYPSSNPAGNQSMAPAIDIDHAYSWSDEPRLAYRKKARYCKRCGKRLSGYNRTKECFHHPIHTPEDQPRRRSTATDPQRRQHKAVRLCANPKCRKPISKGTHCRDCSIRVSYWERKWAAVNPGRPCPDDYKYQFVLSNVERPCPWKGCTRMIKQGTHCKEHGMVYKRRLRIWTREFGEAPMPDDFLYAVGRQATSDILAFYRTEAAVTRRLAVGA